VTARRGIFCGGHPEAISGESKQLSLVMQQSSAEADSLSLRGSWAVAKRLVAEQHSLETVELVVRKLTASEDQNLGTWKLRDLRHS
jgi:hypothetical protein